MMLFKFILNSSLFSCLDLYYRWHDIKDEEICDPMEKIWVKKELYKLSYEFLNFMEFSRLYFDFLGIFPDLILLKKGKKGCIYRAGPAELT